MDGKVEGALHMAFGLVRPSRALILLPLRLSFSKRIRHLLRLGY